ncbi:hypothetical protein LZL87_003956 [Fusarium oxysporum]|nr:hypothetical protein LZL87_003956 [Fusarium oxysporum]
MTKYCGQDRGCFVLVVSGVDIDALIKELPHHALGTLACCIHKGSLMAPTSSYHDTMFNEDLRNGISTKSCLFPDGVGIDLPIGTMVKEKPDCVFATTFDCIFRRGLNAFRIDPFLPPSVFKEAHSAHFFPERLKPRYNTKTRRHLKSLRRYNIGSCPAFPYIRRLLEEWSAKIA